MSATRRDASSGEGAPVSSRSIGCGARLRSVLRSPQLWAGIVLLALPFLVFWQIWWPDPDQRQVFAYGDLTEQYYPMRAFAAGEWRALRVPLWDPYTYGGSPAAAAGLFAAFYPLSAWQPFFEQPFPFVGLELEALLHLGLAGVFAMLFVRERTGRTAAGLIAGATFSLGGFLTSYPILQLGILETAIWLPAVLWLSERGLARRDLRWIALAGLALACAFFAGHPQTFLYIAYASAAYLLVRIVLLRPSRRFAVIAIVVLAGVAAGVSCVQWLPTLELARLSPRAGITYEEASNGFLPAELWGLLRPNAGQWSPLYVGLAPLGLAAVALGFRRRIEVWFWLVVGAAALLLSLGRNGFLYPLAHSVAPGLDIFRNQERAAFLVSFALAVLAGYGWAALLGRVRPGGAVGRGATALLLGVIVFDLCRANQGVILEPAPARGVYPETSITAYLRATGDADWRTSTEGLLPGDGNAGPVYRLRDVSGNSPLHLEAIDAFLARTPEVRAWQLLNVQHLLTRRSLDHGALVQVLAEDDRRLYQVFVGARPAWIAHDYRLAAGRDAALVATADPGLDLTSTAVLESRPDPQPAPAAGDEAARVVYFGPQRVVIEATLAAPGILVASEVAYPGWVARVAPRDASGVGEPASTLRAFGLLRAVALPAGAWRVEWRYEPLSFRVGLLASALALGIASWLVIGRRSRPESGSQARI